MTMMTDIRQRAERYASYRRTVRAIEGLDLNTALDLDIFPGDARAIARKAVYGA